MMQSKEQSVEEYLKDDQMAKDLSFSLQKKEILKRYPTSLFPKEDHSLEEYIFRVLYDLGYRFVNSRYIRESLFYLYAQENPYLVSPTKDLYPRLAKMFNKGADTVERNIRACIEPYFSSILETLRVEIFAAPDKERLTNSMFLLNLTAYAKSHYYRHIDTSNITEAEKVSFLEQLKPENNALEILKQAKLRLEVERFLNTKLNHGAFAYSVTHNVIIDYILYAMEHDLQSKYAFYDNLKLREKWDLQEFHDFENQMQNIAATITKIHEIGNYDIETYKNIFGDMDRHQIPFEYITKVGNYLKEQDFIHELKR